MGTAHVFLACGAQSRFLLTLPPCSLHPPTAATSLTAFIAQDSRHATKQSSQEIYRHRQGSFTRLPSLYPLFLLLILLFLLLSWLLLFLLLRLFPRLYVKYFWVITYTAPDRSPLHRYVHGNRTALSLTIKVCLS